MELTTTAAAPALPELFRALGDATRLRLLRALAAHELSVGEMAEALGMAQSGISRHLAVLREAGLLLERREGTSTMHRVPDEHESAHVASLWPLLQPWLDGLPEAPLDAQRLAAVVAARSTRQSRADAYFQSVAPHWDSIRAAQYGEDLRNLALLELIPREITVLDVGTGTGFMLLGMASRAARVLGVDRSEAMLAKARENLAAAGRPDAELRLGTIEDLPLDDASVDVVLANMVLHHAADPCEALAECARVLAPGGRVVITDLERHDLHWTRDELADEWPGFPADQLAADLAATGFDSVSVRSIGTCTLTRAGGREKHAVSVLLASGTKLERSITAASAASTTSRTP